VVTVADDTFIPPVKIVIAFPLALLINPRAVPVEAFVMPKIVDAPLVALLLWKFPALPEEPVFNAKNASPVLVFLASMPGPVPLVAAKIAEAVLEPLLISKLPAEPVPTVLAITANLGFEGF
jgi:hypothetical protein